MENNIEDQKQKADPAKDLSKVSDVPDEQQLQEQQINIVLPVLEEQYSISKETTTKEAKIEKRWVTKTKTVKVAVTYEEIFINDKKMKSVEEPQILSFLKDKLSSIGKKSNSSEIDVKQSESKKSYVEDKGELVPLMSSSPSDTDSSETEKVIPLWAEEIEVSKKMVKVAEVMIKKRRVTEKKKIDIGIKKEQVTIKYPDGKIQKL
jgi:stress response protein YsnF